MEQELNTTPFEFITNEEKEVPKENIDIQKETTQVLQETFVTGLPDWDLAPPFEMVRRVNRK